MRLERKRVTGTKKNVRDMKDVKMERTIVYQGGNNFAYENSTNIVKGQLTWSAEAFLFVAAISAVIYTITSFCCINTILVFTKKFTLLLANVI